MGFIQSLFEGYKQARPHAHDWKYGYIASDKYSMLHSSQYLKELYAQAKTDEQKDCILAHIYKFQAESIEGYRDIEQKIINERWNL